MTQALDNFLSRAERLMDKFESLMPGQIEVPQWDVAIAFRYKRSTSGAARLLPVPKLNLVTFEALKEVDPQREKIQVNTEQFVNGFPANNVLLTGARGTGKSSLVKACLAAYHTQGLRIVEVEKTDMVDLPDLLELLATRPERFIVFCDDLSFDEGEAGYKALKSALDGSITATSANVLIYATSNRRHLLPEYHSENASYQHAQDGELHPGEVVEEKISLSERFGLWISFYPFNQSEYLAIVKQWLDTFNVDTTLEATYKGDALIWALERGSRSGRVAWQFARDFAGRRSLALT